jgi:hypothetical protein
METRQSLQDGILVPAISDLRETTGEISGFLVVALLAFSMTSAYPFSRKSPHGCHQRSLQLMLFSI